MTAHSEGNWLVGNTPEIEKITKQHEHVGDEDLEKTEEAASKEKNQEEEPMEIEEGVEQLEKGEDSGSS